MSCLVFNHMYGGSFFFAFWEAVVDVEVEGEVDNRCLSKQRALVGFSDEATLVPS